MVWDGHRRGRVDDHHQGNELLEQMVEEVDRQCKVDVYKLVPYLRGTGYYPEVITDHPEVLRPLGIFPPSLSQYKVHKKDVLFERG